MGEVMQFEPNIYNIIQTIPRYTWTFHNNILQQAI
jgi:hypothetical protein